MVAGVLGWRNRLEEGALSAGSEIPAAPVTNVIVQQGAEPWVTAYGVTTSAAGAKLQCDAGAAVTWRAFCLARTNLSIGATVRWRLGTTAGAGNVMDSAALGRAPRGANIAPIAPRATAARSSAARNGSSASGPCNGTASTTAKSPAASSRRTSTAGPAGACSSCRAPAGIPCRTPSSASSPTLRPFPGRSRARPTGAPGAPPSSRGCSA
jgi:hypothetical protein